jgi:hydrogenase nickel incorporation protein HypB
MYSKAKRTTPMPFSLFYTPMRRHHDHGRPHHHPHPADEHPDHETIRSGGGREIKVVRRVLDANDRMAEANRRLFAAHHIFVLNVMSSPGSGKTTVLMRTLEALMPDLRCAVIVGDICSTLDADRLSVSGAPVVQVNTDEFGGDCHLAAHVIERASAELPLDDLDVLIVENVGNLVCPAEFDIGEDRRVVILSTTEGEEKPIKYPLMFRLCQATLLNKIDLLPYLDYDRQLAVDNIRQIHPDMAIFELSAKTGEGFAPWLAWLREAISAKQSA